MSKYLAWALSKLEPDDLNEMLTNPTNVVLECLMKVAQDGNAEHLATVLCRLDPGNRNAVLIRDNGKVLKLFVNKDQDEASAHLALVLAGDVMNEVYTGLNSDALKSVLTNTANGVLYFLAKAAKMETLNLWLLCSVGSSSAI
jgi:hypothetical protein